MLQDNPSAHVDIATNMSDATLKLIHAQIAYLETLTPDQRDDIRQHHDLESTAQSSRTSDDR
jgi:hypothetical protein